MLSLPLTADQGYHVQILEYIKAPKFIFKQY